MKTIQKTILLITLFTWTISMAQTYKETDLLNDPNGSDLGFFMSQLDFSTSNNTAKPVDNRHYTVGGNNVYIAQIGMDNKATVISSSEVSDIRVGQNGNNNQIHFQASASNIETSLLQNGDNHGVYYSNPFYIDNHKSQITQQGNNQNIEWYGGNTISEKMEVSMKGANQSIIVRNYN